MRIRRIRGFALLVSGAALALTLTLANTTPASARSGAHTHLFQGPDLSNAILRLEDLPLGFEPVMVEFDSSLQNILGAGLYVVPDIPNAELINFTAYWANIPIGNDRNQIYYVISGLFTPLPSEQQLALDQQFADPVKEAAIHEQSSGGSAQVDVLSGAKNIGESRLALSYTTEISKSDTVIARRGPVLILVQVHYDHFEGEQPIVNAVDLARILDDRVAEVVGRETTGFREAGPLVPEITTYIPTPLDISTQPTVVGANLLLAALMMLPLAAATETFTRMVNENAAIFKNRLRPPLWLGKLQKNIGTFFDQRVGKTHFRPIVKIGVVMIFYGLVFSLLDKTWNPLSLKGLILFVSMIIAYGIVGLADDIVQWRRIRRWGLEAQLEVRPTNIFLALISTATTRVLALVPGLMFGTPKALQTDEEQFDEPKRNILLKTSAVTGISIVLAGWLPTIATGLLQSLKLSAGLANIIDGFQAFLLVIFAVAIENLFVQALGFSGSFGQALKQKNRWLWIALLVFVTFVFFHTLLNPRGDLAAAVTEGSVILFLSVAVAFIVFTFGMWYYLRKRTARMQP